MGGTFLKANMDALVNECLELQVPPEQIHYKQKGYQPSEAEPWKQHTVETRALFVLLITCLKSKPLKSHTKQRAVQMFLACARVAFSFASRQGLVPHFQVPCNDSGGNLQLLDLFSMKLDNALGGPMC